MMKQLKQEYPKELNNMAITKDDLLKIIFVAIEAGKATKEIYDTDFNVEIKNDNSPLTLADKTSHNIIIKGLNFTGLPVMSEEGKSITYEERKNWEYYWLIDPLDGTKEFIKKNDEFTINIALIKRNKPIAGIVYIPVLDILYWGLEFTGSFKSNNAEEHLKSHNSLTDLIKLSQKLPVSKLTEEYTIVASRSHMSKETEEFINKQKEKHRNIKTMSRGSSIKLCMIAEGQADIYPRFAPTSEWDTAAGHAVINCSGGKVLKTNMKEEIEYNKRDILNPWFVATR